MPIQILQDEKDAMKLIIFNILFIILFFSVRPGWAQQKAVPDSLAEKKLQAPSDSSKKHPHTSGFILDNWPGQAMQNITDSLLEPVYRFKDLLFLNYNGLGDVFRLRPDVQVFDFLDMGLPRYVASLHLWPQQTRFYFNDYLINDPLNGMFNTRFFYPDALDRVEFFGSTKFSAHSAQIPKDAGSIGFYSRPLNPQKPYTRIMYREGDFGYTDLDITFAERLGRKTLVHLGGINRDYGPNGYRGTHYRGRLVRQFARHLLGTFSYHKSSEHVSFLDRYGTEFGQFRYNEIWELFGAKLMHLNDNLKTDWQIRALLNDSQRNYRFYKTDLRPQLRYNRLTFQGSKDWNWRRFYLKTLCELEQDKAWGTVYDRKYTDSRLKLQTAGTFKPLDSLHINLNAALRYQWDQSLQVEPALNILWQKDGFAVHFNASRYARFPSLHERFFLFKGFSGQRNVVPESHGVMQTGIIWAPLSWNQTKLSLIYHSIAHEILFNGSSFFNGSNRNFAFSMVQSAIRFFKFDVRMGGQLGLLGNFLLGPRYSGFAQIRYHDRWIHGHLIVDATGTVQWFGSSENIAYQPYVEHFYSMPGKSDGFYLLTYKIVGTIKDARLFMEMDNPLGLRYQIIKGYPEVYRRVRFGVSWVLWN